MVFRHSSTGLLLKDLVIFVLSLSVFLVFRHSSTGLLLIDLVIFVLSLSVFLSLWNHLFQLSYLTGVISLRIKQVIFCFTTSNLWHMTSLHNVHMMLYYAKGILAQDVRKLGTGVGREKHRQRARQTRGQY